MNVATLILQLQNAKPNDEVILIVEDHGMKEVSTGITTKVLWDGVGAEQGKCEIYGVA